MTHVTANSAPAGRSHLSAGTLIAAGAEQQLFTLAIRRADHAV